MDNNDRLAELVAQLRKAVLAAERDRNREDRPRRPPSALTPRPLH
jgi:hypothetical protein